MWIIHEVVEQWLYITGWSKRHDGINYYKSWLNSAQSLSYSQSLYHLTINTAKTQDQPRLKKVAGDIANSLRIGQTTLKRNNEVRNLGVVMDTSLSWQSHLQRSSSRMNSALIQLARIKHLILKSDLRRAIQALALNHLHYYTLVWSTAGTSATAPIRRSLRMAERLACSQFKDLGLLCREKIKVLRSRITRKRSSRYAHQQLSAIKAEG